MMKRLLNDTSYMVSEDAICGIALPMKLLLPILLAALTIAASAKVPVILDTDIGTDMYDAFALALVLASPELDVRGVTTVSDDAYTRAMIVCRFLEAAGRQDIPVAAGRPRLQTPAMAGQ